MGSMNRPESDPERPSRMYPPAESSSGRAAALHYAANGWPVLPVAGMAGERCSCRRDCESPAKHPLTRHGVHDSTTDSRRIRQWWGHWPGANVGVATGTASGVAVVDVDVHSGGRRALDALRTAGWDLPPTLMAFSGGGGFHLFYGLPADARIGNTVGRLPGASLVLPGIDLRGDGGYVVVAPSLHRSGHHYRWSAPAAELAPLPLWLLRQRPIAAAASTVDRVRAATPYGAAALAEEVFAVRRLVAGVRNDGLNRAAFCLGQLVGGGELPEDAVHAVLLTAALSIGLGEVEANRTIRSGLSAGEQVPRTAQRTIAARRAGQTEEADHVPAMLESERWAPGSRPILP